MGKKTWTDNSHTKSSNTQNVSKFIHHGEMQFKATLMYHFPPTGLTKIKIRPHILLVSLWENRSSHALLHLHSCKLVQHLWRETWQNQAELHTHLPVSAAIPLLGICLEDTPATYKNRHTHYNVGCYRKILETAQKFINRRGVESTLEPPHSGGGRDLRELTWSDFQDMRWSEESKVRESFWDMVSFMWKRRRSREIHSFV